MVSSVKEIDPTWMAAHVDSYVWLMKTQPSCCPKYPKQDSGQEPSWKDPERMCQRWCWLLWGKWRLPTSLTVMFIPVSGIYKLKIVWLLQPSSKEMDVVLQGLCFFPHICLGFHGSSNSKKICLPCGRSRFDHWVRKIPWRRKWLPTPVFLLENSIDRGAWQATVHGVTKSQIQLRG